MDSSLIDAMRRQLDRTLTVSDIENQLNDILADGKILPLEAEMLPILSEKLDEALGRPRTEPVSYGNRTAAPETPHDRGERAAACPYDSAADDIPLPPSVAVDPLLPDEPASGQAPADTAPGQGCPAARPVARSYRWAEICTLTRKTAASTVSAPPRIVRRQTAPLKTPHAPSRSR